MAHWRRGAAFLPFGLQSIPVTRSLLGISLATFLTYFVLGPGHRDNFALWLVFQSTTDPMASWGRAWTWLTYSLIETHPLWLLMKCYWLYVVGGSLERGWGWRRFLSFYLAITPLAALILIPSPYLGLGNLALAGLIVPLTACTVAWAAGDPELPLKYWGIEIRLKHLALIDVALLYFTLGLGYGGFTPVTGLLLLVSPAAAWFWVRRPRRLGPPLPRRALRVAPRNRPSRRSREEDGTLYLPTAQTRERIHRPESVRKLKEAEEIARLKKLLGEEDE